MQKIVLFSSLLILSSNAFAANTALDKGASDEMEFYTGGTVNASLTTTGDFSVTGNIIGDAPTADNHMATKAYVDSNPTCSLATNGYCTYSNGYTEQWGTIASCSNGCTVTFPTTFTTTYNITLTPQDTTNLPVYAVSSFSTTGFTIAHWEGNSSEAYFWKATGVK